MARGFFITATDTGVGKTVVAGALVRFLKGFLGLRVGAMKPIESGCPRQNGHLVPGDGTFLKEMAEMEEPIEEVTPYTFEAPLAPVTASEMEGTRIDINVIKEKFKILGAKYDAVVVEGMGGLLVPIKRDHSIGGMGKGGYYVLDLAMELELPLIIVARASLGTINHTLLTVRCALESGARVAGVVINHQTPASSEGLAGRTGPSAIKDFSPVPVIGEFPFTEVLNAETIGKAACENLGMAALQKFL
ncbi:MAG: dethiobiotin synthase [Nitrospiraceae bacterium]|nr:dethiobiotin synthase [Nitrospiraceae bacterium]